MFQKGGFSNDLIASQFVSFYDSATAQLQSIAHKCVDHLKHGIGRYFALEKVFLWTKNYILSLSHSQSLSSYNKYKSKDMKYEWLCMDLLCFV